MLQTFLTIESFEISRTCLIFIFHTDIFFNYEPISCARCELWARFIKSCKADPASCNVAPAFSIRMAVVSRRASRLMPSLAAPSLDEVFVQTMMSKIASTGDLLSSNESRGTPLIAFIAPKGVIGHAITRIKNFNLKSRKS